MPSRPSCAFLPTSLSPWWLGVRGPDKNKATPKLGSLRSLRGGVTRTVQTWFSSGPRGRFGTHLRPVLSRLAVPSLSCPGTGRASKASAGVGGVRPDPRRPGSDPPHKCLWREGGSGHRGAGAISITTR